MFIRNITLTGLIVFICSVGFADKEGDKKDANVIREVPKSKLTEVQKTKKLEKMLEDFIAAHPDFLKELDKSSEYYEGESIRTFHDTPNYNEILKEEKTGTYWTKEKVIDLTSPKYRFEYNLQHLALQTPSTRYDSVVGAKKILKKDPKADFIRVNRFMMLVSDAAVAEGDQKITIFNSSKDIIDTYNAVKDDPIALASVQSILKIYAKEFNPSHLKAADSFRVRRAILKYAEFHKEEIEKMNQTPESFTDRILQNKSFLGVGDNQSLVRSTIDR